MIYQLCKEDEKTLALSKESLEKDKKIIEENMKLLNWVSRDKAAHPYYREKEFKLDNKYNRMLKLKKPKERD